MLGAVKMEGHESSDWNSYYADTQEVRGGQQAGGSWSPYWGRPGEAGPRQGGGAGGLGAPPPCHRCLPTGFSPGRAWAGPASQIRSPAGELDPGDRRSERARRF